ncbi:MAG: 16S rRNA (uracil(1498)-N(3))-methyltransferase [Proteobacteria bacterium]|nr:16S rRNA (uracil(1498)-N(3))-methyltransferase [Pseudomonadota bacterium]
MRLSRIYYQFLAKLDEQVTIKGDKAHYLRTVLRVKVGGNLKIFNHNCQEFMAKIISVNKKSIEIKLTKQITTITPSKLNITIVQSLSKGERMDYIVQKATELGVTTIQPITSEFCEVKLKNHRLEKKLKHWHNIAISACEQSFRADIPTILPPIAIYQYSQSQHQGIFLEPKETQTIQQIAKKNWHKLDIAIGPEGGWSDTDLTLLKSAGLTGINFGQRILRTETVTPAIMAAIHSLWGDFV